MRLARRPYDLRHAAISGWLNAGVPVTQVAEWAGNESGHRPGPGRTAVRTGNWASDLCRRCLLAGDVAADELAGDDPLLELVGALEDFQNLGVAVHLLEAD